MMKQTVSGIVIVLFFIALITGLHYGIYALLSKTSLFAIKEITVKGNKALSKQEIVTLSGLDTGMDIFSFGLGEIADNVLQHRGVQGATVRRFPPDRVEIEVKENAPVALVTDGTSYYLCDKAGRVIGRMATGQVPVLSSDAGVRVNGGLVADDWLLALLASLDAFQDAGKIKNVVYRKSEGFYIIVRDLEGTLFFTGKGLPDEKAFAKVMAIAARIRQEKLKISYVDVNRENAIGYKQD